MIRLYFNKRGERPWSVDEGPGTEERTFSQVSIFDAHGITRYDPAAGDNKETPTAWIEFPCGYLCQSSHGRASIRE